MKKKVFHIEIPRPCNESRQNMTPTELGAFCSDCQKEVIDFTQKTPAEIATHFAKNNGKSCGRFYTKQLNTNYTHYEPQKQNNLKYAAALAVGLLISENNFAQESIKSRTEIVDTAYKKQVINTNQNTRIIHGTIKDTQREPLIGVNVIGKGTTIGTVTDIDGKYTLELPKNVTEIIFMYVGYKTIEKPILSLKMDVILDDDSNEITVGIIISVEKNYDPVYSGFPNNRMHKKKKKK